MQRQHGVRLDDTLAAVKEAVGTLETAIEQHRLAVSTRIADIEFVLAWAVESDHLVEDDGLDIQPRRHLRLRGC